MLRYDYKNSTTRKEAISRLESESPEDYQTFLRLSELESNPSYQFMQREAKRRYDVLAAWLAYADPEDETLPGKMRDLNYYARLTVGFASELMEEMLDSYFVGNEEKSQPIKEAVKSRLRDRLAAETL